MLFKSDFQTSTWKRFTQELQDRLQSLRELNDQASHDATKTAAIRGQIAEVKRLLALRAERSESTEGNPGDEPA